MLKYIEDTLAAPLKKLNYLATQLNFFPDSLHDFSTSGVYKIVRECM